MQTTFENMIEHAKDLALPDGTFEGYIAFSTKHPHERAGEQPIYGAKGGMHLGESDMPERPSFSTVKEFEETLRKMLFNHSHAFHYAATTYKSTGWQHFPLPICRVEMRIIRKSSFHLWSKPKITTIGLDVELSTKPSGRCTCGRMCDYGVSFEIEGTHKVLTALADFLLSGKRPTAQEAERVLVTAAARTAQ